MGSTTYQELNCCREGTSIGVKETIKYTEEMRGEREQVVVNE